MNGQPDEHYLRRALQRKVDETRLGASNAATAIFRKANAAGALNSGNTLIAINEKMDSLYATQIESMSQFLYNATGKLDRSCADLLAEYGEQLVLVIVDPVRSLYETSLHRGLTGIDLKMADELRERLRDRKLKVVDDYRHGMLRDMPLKKDPFVSVTSNIVNSPGAILQSGVGHLTQTVHQQEVAPFVAALDSFLADKAVQQLDTDRREALNDVAEVLRSELHNSQPVPGKVRRWGDRLLGLATDFGVQASAGTVAAILAKLLGY